MSNVQKTKINKEALRKEIAADLGIKIDADDPLLLAAHVAAIVTRDTIAQERAHNADNQLLSYGDVRTVLMDVRDETIKVADQIVGVIWMKVQEGLEERVSALMGERYLFVAMRRGALKFVSGVAVGAAAALLGMFFFFEGG